MSSFYTMSPSILEAPKFLFSWSIFYWAVAWREFEVMRILSMWGNEQVECGTLAPRWIPWKHKKALVMPGSRAGGCPPQKGCPWPWLWPFRQFLRKDLPPSLFKCSEDLHQRSCGFCSPPLKLIGWKNLALNGILKTILNSGLFSPGFKSTPIHIWLYLHFLHLEEPQQHFFF